MGRSEKRDHGLIWKIEFTKTAADMLRSISDVRIRGSIIKAIDELASTPDLRGKELFGSLEGFYSVRVAQQRYRVIYSLQDETITVLVVAVGIRREGHKSDIYRLAKKLLALGLLEPEREDEESAEDADPQGEGDADEESASHDKS